MGKALRWLLSLVVLIGTTGVGGASAAAATAAEPKTEAGTTTGTAGSSHKDIKDRLLAIRGMSLIEEKPVDGYRFFVLNYTQPVDHRHPGKGTFQQRITLLHRSTARPTVFYTSGYGVSTDPRRSEPTQIVDGNQVSLEYRFFTPSRPEPADWSKLDIWQAASDQHRIFRALKRIYPRNWLATGGSKGGMTATYYERFYPRDMDGVVAYVAPNDVVDGEDSAYDEFFRQVSTEECRTALDAVQREALVRRGEMTDRYRQWAEENDATFSTIGSLDQAYESAVLDLVWAFWQYSTEADCNDVPKPTAATEELYGFVDEVSGFSSYTDQGLEPYTPYYYQAGTELGAPTVQTPHLDDLLRYPGMFTPRAFVPDTIPMRWRDGVMRDVDRWVRHNAERMLFVYGENDPWGAEPFRLGKGAEDSYVFTAPGANHGANIGGLVEEERAKATAEVLEWAGVAPAAVRSGEATAEPLAKRDSALDQRSVERRPALLP
ncbi:S28 family serine protease [Streptomyces sp. TP-A0874]|uniref:S28 family serine protease n=1 Tax=Streptomyces sp. TP-A0874 TaxID=549819 RepID=UPI0008535C4F|nr:S28 family serine protease [Streptomyces sp. TP-A0874]